MPSSHKDRKMRVLLVTMVGRNYNDNYGGVLQGLGLQQFLEENGYSVEVLDFEPRTTRYSLDSMIALAKELGLRKFFGAVLKKTVQLVMKGSISRKYYNSLLKARKERFSTFRELYMRFTRDKYTHFSELLNSADVLKRFYDVFIVGSDQVWNAPMVAQSLPVYLLSFIRNVGKISYAASVSASIPEKFYDLYRESLKDFMFVSVREEESARELAKIIGFTPKVNVDPTFLINSRSWDKFMQRPKVELEDSYLFVYDLYRSRDILSVVERLARKANLEYVNFSVVSWLKRREYKRLRYTCFTDGPSEFLWLLKNSRFVITSSFHGVVFSLIFKKPFYAILWDRKDKEKQNGRILDLLSKVGLEDRAFKNPSLMIKRGLDENIEWEAVEEKIEQLRSDSASWILNALEELKSSGAFRKAKNVSSIQNCAGCFACKNVCPASAIEMGLSEEGFYIPRVSESRCVSCTRCIEVCPVLYGSSQSNGFSKPRTYAAWSTDDRTRISSSSGGIYPELAKAILRRGGVVVGVKWNDEWLPEHVLIDTTDTLEKTFGSKYVQSKVGMVLRQVVELVKSGREVLFVGLPCQVVGLRNILKTEKVDDRTLYTVDLICHGVASTMVFKKYLSEKFGKYVIKSISFRAKVTGWTRFNMLLECEGYRYSRLFGRDAFGYGYLKNIFLNRICYNCPFSKLPRPGDITIGDFWGVPKEYMDERGVSVVLTNTLKGEQLFKLIKDVENSVQASETVLEVAVHGNPRLLSGKLPTPPEREWFFSDLQNKDWNYLSKRYIKPPVGFRLIFLKLNSLKRRVTKILKRL